MKVKPNQNPVVPVQGSKIADVTDPTSNTMQAGERRKPETPFAKDSFESFRFDKPKQAFDGSSKEAVAQYNPKELGIDQSVLWQSQPPSDSANEVETTSTKENLILYNGHAGLGENK